MQTPARSVPRLLLATAGWVVVCWIVFGWPLGYPSFWDPDEATYAETTREMLAARNWLGPTYDGAPFFDKPPLFFNLQMTSFAMFGATELAPRLPSAPSAVALALAGLAFLLSLAIAPEVRTPLLRLRWGMGLLIVGALSAPWFLYMWLRFGDAFVTGYVLKENLWLFSGSLYGAQRSWLFYP